MKLKLKHSSNLFQWIFFLLQIFFCFSVPVTESDDNTWFDASPDTTNKEEIKEKQFRDVDIQCQLNQTEDLKTKIQQISFENPTLISFSNENPYDDLDQIISLFKNLQNEMKDLQRYERL